MELIPFYKKCLSDILQIKNPNSLMKKIIDTIHSTNERIYIYDVNKKSNIKINRCYFNCLSVLHLLFNEYFFIY